MWPPHYHKGPQRSWEPPRRGERGPPAYDRSVRTKYVTHGGIEEYAWGTTVPSSFVIETEKGLYLRWSQSTEMFMTCELREATEMRLDEGQLKMRDGSRLDVEYHMEYSRKMKKDIWKLRGCYSVGRSNDYGWYLKPVPENNDVWTIQTHPNACDEGGDTMSLDVHLGTENSYARTGLRVGLWPRRSVPWQLFKLRKVDP